MLAGHHSQMLKLLERVNPGSFRDDWGSLTGTPQQNVGPFFFFEKKLGSSGFQIWGPLFQPKSNLLKLSIFLVFNNPRPWQVCKKQTRARKRYFRRPTKNGQNDGASLLCSKVPPKFRGLCGTIAVESNTKQLHLQSLGLKKMGGGH